MKNTKKMLLTLALLCFAFAFTPVGEIIGTNVAEDVMAEESQYVLNYETLNLVVGTSTNDGYTGLANLSVVGFKYKTTADRPKWTSSDPTVVYVAPTGRVIGKAIGSAVVTARDKRGNYLGECVVTVSARTEETLEKDGYTYKDVNEEGKTFSIVGRWYDKTLSNGEVVPFTVSSGSSFYFRVTGTSKVKLYFTKTTSKTPVFAYQVDNKTYKRKGVSSCSIIDLGDTKTHYVKVFINSICTLENRYQGAGVGIRSVVPYSSTGVIRAVVPTNNRIAFYGDSITEGVNAIGSSYYPSSCSAVHSFAGYTARRLKATPIFCGYASTGLAKTGKNEPSYGKVYYTNASTAMRRFTNEVAVTSYDSKVKVVVLEYGTNDTCAKESFQTLYTALIAQAADAYPQALIVCMTPFYQQKYAAQIKAAAAVNVANGVNVKVFDTKGITIRGYVENLHPTSAVSNRDIAPKLADFISTYSEDF